uniref:Uncharacterized protein n=1 Tax=Anguilla anguilla TaxID=7936 RepID=A0A0E9XV84_ANGAN
MFCCFLTFLFNLSKPLQFFFNKIKCRLEFLLQLQYGLFHWTDRVVSVFF